MQARAQAPGCRGQVQLGAHALRAQAFLDGSQQAVNTGAAQRRHPRARQLPAIDVIETGSQTLDQIDLVVNQHLRQIVRTDFDKHRFDIGDVLIALRIGCIDHVQEQIRIARLGQSRTERGDEIMRQIADEADCICEHDRSAVEAVEATHCRIERREQLVGHIHRGPGQRIEQGRLAGVGITDQRNDRQRIAQACATRLGALCLELLHALLQLLDAIAE